MTAEIWAIGGGKGGTGKTFVASSLGIKLAQAGKKVILLDADLGGGNLHSFIRIKRPQNSLTDFFEERLPLEEIIEDTQIPNLRLITSDIYSINPQGIRYTQKLRFFRHIKHLETDYILVDLGGGASLDIIDTFLLADKLLAVIVPEITAVDNLYQYIRRVIFRKVVNIMHKWRLKNEAMDAWRCRKARNINTELEWIKYLESISSESKEALTTEMENFRMSIVMNQVRNEGQIDMGHSVKSIITKLFGIDTRYVGYIPYHDDFWKMLNQIQPFSNDSGCMFANDEFSSILTNLHENKQMAFTSHSTAVNREISYA